MVLIYLLLQMILVVVGHRLCSKRTLKMASVCKVCHSNGEGSAANTGDTCPTCTQLLKDGKGLPIKKVRLPVWFRILNFVAIALPLLVWPFLIMPDPLLDPFVNYDVDARQHHVTDVVYAALPALIPVLSWILFRLSIRLFELCGKAHFLFLNYIIALICAFFLVS